MEALGFKPQHDYPQSDSTQPVFRTGLAGCASIEGKGIHSGIPVTLTLAPASPGSGYKFQRMDLPGQPEIAVHYDNLVLEELERRTTLRLGSAVVHTIEHVLSALAAAGVHDALIQVTAAEPPFLDGSALPFAEKIREIGLTPTQSPIQPITIPRPLSFRFGNSEVCAIPADDFRVSFFFNSAHPNLQAQSHTLSITPESYMAEIASARTFCFFEEIEYLRKAGLIKGANLNSAVVIGRKGIINDSLRFPDEPVRHKILDFIGDMALLGRPLKGHFMAWRAGHRVNAEFGLYLKKELSL